MVQSSNFTIFSFWKPWRSIISTCFAKRAQRHSHTVIERCFVRNIKVSERLPRYYLFLNLMQSSLCLNVNSDRELHWSGASPLVRCEHYDRERKFSIPDTAEHRLSYILHCPTMGQRFHVPLKYSSANIGLNISWIVNYFMCPRFMLIISCL